MAIKFTNGTIAELRDGSRYLVTENRIVNNDGYLDIKDYNNSLKDKYDEERYDVVRIYKIISCAKLNSIFNLKNLELIWQRRECEVDWSLVPVDTKILVKSTEEDIWERRYFAKFAGGWVFAWSDGKTSWSTGKVVQWRFAKLAEEQ